MSNEVTFDLIWQPYSTFPGRFSVYQEWIGLGCAKVWSATELNEVEEGIPPQILRKQAKGHLGKSKQAIFCTKQTNFAHFIHFTCNRLIHLPNRGLCWPSTFSIPALPMDDKLYFKRFITCHCQGNMSFIKAIVVVSNDLFCISSTTIFNCLHLSAYDFGIFPCDHCTDQHTYVNFPSIF